jgi:malonyl-CoA O-methyltransferase
MRAIQEVLKQQHKVAIASHFSRAAQSYEHHNLLQRWCAARLIEWLPAATGLTADIGCGPAVNTEALLARTKHYIGIDIASGMLAKAQRNYPNQSWLRADLEALPFAAASIDTLYANLAVQWADDLTATLNHWLSVLRPSGTVVISTILAGSLTPLADYFQQYTCAPRHNHFYSASTLQQILSNVSGATVQFEVEQITIPYLTVRAMLYDLKGIGANYQQQRQQPLTRSQLACVEAAMESHRDRTGNLPLHWVVGFIKLTKD